MILKNLKYLFLLMMSTFVLTSCSETDEESNSEYADWQAKNETAFAEVLAKAKQEGEANNWYIYRKWSMDNQTANKDNNDNPITPTYKELEDNIVVQVLGQGEGSVVKPLYTDSVMVSYKGMLMNDYVFDSTFTGDYDVQKAQTANFLTSGLVDGFTTALMKMRHIGDHWMVTMPYTLGYGSQQSSDSNIPAYSMLKFEIVLKGCYKNGKWIKK